MVDYLSFVLTFPLRFGSPSPIPDCNSRGMSRDCPAFSVRSDAELAYLFGFEEVNLEFCRRVELLRIRQFFKRSRLGLTLNILPKNELL